MISATSLSSSIAPSWVMPGFHAPAGSAMMAASSAAVIIQPQVNSTALRGEDMPSRCLIRSWLAPTPSTRTMIFRRNLAGTCRTAAASTSRWSGVSYSLVVPA